IYRNPEGDNISKTEYFRVTDYGLYLFSVEKKIVQIDIPPCITGFFVVQKPLISIHPHV
ncbi:hypothetical protein LCGC14_2616840, partial [marine sediment metagenome]